MFFCFLNLKKLLKLLKLEVVFFVTSLSKAKKCLCSGPLWRISTRPHSEGCWSSETPSIFSFGPWKSPRASVRSSATCHGFLTSKPHIPNCSRNKRNQENKQNWSRFPNHVFTARRLKVWENSLQNQQNLTRSPSNHTPFEATRISRKQPDTSPTPLSLINGVQTTTTRHTYPTPIHTSKRHIKRPRTSKKPRAQARSGETNIQALEVWSFSSTPVLWSLCLLWRWPLWRTRFNVVSATAFPPSAPCFHWWTEPPSSPPPS